jgi:GT2 family glycosyltransferase
VVILNPDTELADASLNRLVAFATARHALAGPRLLNPDGSVQPSASGPPVGAWPWIGAIIPGALQPPGARRHTEPWRSERTVRVTWLTGACVAGPRDALLGLGPFDPSIHLYAEDMDLGLRAADAGIPSYFCPDICRIVHVGGASTRVALHGATIAHLGATNRRAVVRRAFGPRRERYGWLAQLLNLRLRATAKRVLGADAGAELDALAATRAAPPADVPPLRVDPDP